MSQKTSSSKTEKSALLRKGSHSKMVLKEKIVQIYEAFFRGEDPSAGNPNFWDELFLLKVNAQFIENEFEKLNGEQLLALKETINDLFYKCIDGMKQDHPIRLVNAMLTLCALVRGVYKKSRGDCGFDVIDFLVGFDVAERHMQLLVERLNHILLGEFSSSLKSIVINVFLVLVTLLATQSTRQGHGHEAVLLLTILVQYRKYESANPYILKLSILDDELALTGYAEIVSSALTDFNRQHQMKNLEPEGGFFATLTNMVGSMFVAEEKKMEAINGNDAILLALYEAIHLNRNFITTLTHSHTPSAPCSPPSTPTTLSPEAPPLEGSPDPPDKPPETEPAPETSSPTNLLVTYLEYCSIVMQDIKDPVRFSNAKLCLIILTCIAEDQYANSLMHDVNMNFRVPLHKRPMRHRKAQVDKKPPSRPLACASIDLSVEFILSHLMKNFPNELYLSVVASDYNIHGKICGQVINIFNLFITYGDTFLPNPNSYDELYYEIIRVHQTFDNLYSMALRYTTTEGQWKDSAVRLTNALVNVRAIINHFTPKVDSWAAANQLSSLTEEQVLDVVRSNYDSLTLKLQDNLDQYERYSEKPRETAFFTQLVRQIAVDVRKSSSDVSSQQTKVLQESSKVTQQ